MPGFVHNVVLSLVRRFGPDVMADAVDKGVVAREPLADKLAKKHQIVESSFQSYRVFTYGTPTDGQPVLVYLHGGGFVLGMTQVHFEVLGRLHKATGVPVIAPDFPLPPETDAHSVVAWTTAHLRSVMADYPSSPILLAGESAGGHLVLATAQALEASERGRLKALFPLFGVFDLTNDPSEMEIAKEEVLLKAETMRRVLARFVGDANREDPTISPLFGALDNLPPVHLFSGDKDPLHADSLALRERLQALGATHTHHIFPGYGHVFFFFPTPDGNRGMKTIADAMRQAMAA